MAEHVDVLRRKIENLRGTRDLLPPRLLSGQVPLVAENGSQFNLVLESNLLYYRIP